jgi:hypothetical protein
MVQRRNVSITLLLPETIFSRSQFLFDMPMKQETIKFFLSIPGRHV